MSLINKKALRNTILEQWKLLRGAACPESVSKETYDYFEAELLNLVKKAVKSHPTTGKRFKPPISLNGS